MQSKETTLCRALGAFKMAALATAIMGSMAVAASSDDASRETSVVLQIAVQPSFKYDTNGRTEFLRVLTAYCTATINSLPTNTPQEQEWVNAEGGNNRLE
jgi:hypothetical protein